ncbi:MAG: tetratricopeptide repeat protein [Candidatus Firestonebacteria bacterium]|nr:tetratricopeptide repeat protein [Candidatus Firestonebacteria bacterium]
MNAKKAPAIIFVIALSFYILTACPTIYVGDSGEIVAAAYTLGIPHPPGYPLYTILSKIMTFIPVAGIAFRVNILAGFFGALACSVFFLLLSSFNSYFRTAYKSRLFEISAFLLALIFAFSRTFWAQSVQAKGGLYTLNILLLVSLILLILKRRSYIEVGLVAGLGLANHNTFAPLVPVFLGCYYAGLKKDFAAKRLRLVLSAIGVSLVTAFILYLYLLFRAKAEPPMNWGEPSSFTGLFHHVFRGQYGAISEKIRSFGLFFKQSAWFFKTLGAQFTFIPFLLAIPGAFLFYKKTRSYFFALLLAFFLVTFGIILMTNFWLNALNLYMVEVFFLPAYAVLIIFAVFGTCELHGKLPGFLAKALLPCLGGLLFFCVYSNYSYSDRSRNYFAYDYGINLLKSLEKKGSLLVAGDNTAFSVAYLTMVEKKSPETVIYDDFGLIFRNNNSGLKKIPAADYLPRREYIKNLLLASGGPVYFVLGSNLHRDIYTVLSKDYTATPSGLLFKVIRKNSEPGYFDYSKLVFRGLEDDGIYKDTIVKNLIAQYHYFRGEYLRLKGKTGEAEEHFLKADEYGREDEQIQNMLGISNQESGNLSGALGRSKKAVELDPYSPQAWNNYGVVLERTGEAKAAVEAYRKAAGLDKSEPRYTNNLAGAYFNTGNTAGSLNIYLGLLASNEKAVNYRGLGMVYEKLGKQTEAEYAYKKGLSFGASFELYLGLGNLYLNTNRPLLALEYYQEAIKIDPVSEKACNNLGVAYLRLNRLGEAEKSFQRALEINPNFLESYTNLARIRFAAGKKEEAVKICEYLLTVDPKNAFALSVLGQLKQGK